MREKLFEKLQWASTVIRTSTADYYQFREAAHLSDYRLVLVSGPLYKIIGFARDF